MKTPWYYRLPVKITAVFLAMLFLCSAVLLGVGVVLITAAAGSENSITAAQKDIARDNTWNYAYEAITAWREQDDLSALAERSNYYFTVSDHEGVKMGGNYAGQPVLTDDTCGFDYEKYYDEATDTWYGDYNTTITVYFKQPQKMPQNDWCAITLRMAERFFGFRTIAVVLCLSGLLLGLVLTVYLCCAVGHRSADGPPVCSLFDRIPFDLFVAAYTAVVVLGLFILADTNSWQTAALALCLLIPCAIGLLLSFVVSLANRIKTRTLLQNTVIWCVLQWIGRGLRFVGRGISALFRALPLLWKTVLAVVLLSLIEFLVIAFTWWEMDNYLVFWVVEKLLLIPLILWFVWGLRKLQKGCREIADGALSCRVPTAGLFGDLKATALDLERVGGGLQKAVDARLKSERFRTELITNVSHDIKTPLTSIVNYVDLIKKEEPENERMRDYIEVLDRQSGRLKKLIEDLVEASKASTGNLAVNPVPCELGTLLSQMVGEYGEKLEMAQLTPILHQPEEPVTILADSRHLWRILDNLLNNVCKYALPGTRVYLDLLKNEREALIVFRNISRSELNVSPEELTERFVRGDSSRNTEGSGLGLSIASSLTALQKGRLEVTVDGDLFKVILTFPMQERE